MIVLTAYAIVLADKVQEFEAASSANKAQAIQESGCMRFDYYASAEDASKYVFVEEWETRDHLDAHFATPHFAEFMGTMNTCLAHPPEIRIFNATLAD